MQATRSQPNPHRPGTHPYRGLRGSLADRLWARVQRGAADECWPWTGPLDGDRGRLGKGGKHGGLVRSHQAAWIVTHGPVPSGQVVRHWCDNAVCCNPDHLELGSQAQNVDDMIQRGRLNTRGITPGSRPKTTREQAEQIRALIAAGTSKRAIAEQFGISETAVRRIHRRVVWA